ncbi:alpha/beta fold hydrolase [Paraburkholderia sp. DHOC27]|uniref:alpha/beta fold hydrolase n=1 Tax=Paraburkholderia sp. DHOC27 TaxID=2303330 RepID=UPI0015F34E2C|nr:alpha/beta hydrolase [Paraburkholderia sp. DHOC27]
MNTITRREIDVLGQRVSYLEAGSGERVVVLLHGMTSDATNWAETLPALASSGYRAIAPDHLGFGQSSKPNIPIKPRTLVDVIESLLDVLKIGSVTLVGQSMGGHVAGLFAADSPVPVNGLVLVNAGYGLALSETDDVRDLGHAKTRGGLWALNPATRREARALLAQVFHNQALVSDENVEAFFAARLGTGDGWAIQSIAESWARREDMLDPLLERLGRSAVLVVQSRHDQITPLELGLKIHDGIPGSQLAVLEDCGHAPPVEVPDVFNRVLIEFLSSVWV